MEGRAQGGVLLIKGGDGRGKVEALQLRNGSLQLHLLTACHRLLRGNRIQPSADAGLYVGVIRQRLVDVIDGVADLVVDCCGGARRGRCLRLQHIHQILHCRKDASPA